VGVRIKHIGLHSWPPHDVNLFGFLVTNRCSQYPNVWVLVASLVCTGIVYR